MKTRTKRILLLSLCVALLVGCAVFAFAAPKYGDTKVVGHVVYSYRPGGKYAKAHAMWFIRIGPAENTRRRTML